MHLLYIYLTVLAWRAGWKWIAVAAAFGLALLTGTLSYYLVDWLVQRVTSGELNYGEVEIAFTNVFLGVFVLLFSMGVCLLWFANHRPSTKGSVMQDGNYAALFVLTLVVSGFSAACQASDLKQDLEQQEIVRVSPHTQ